jgi:D-glycero-D-manno-heptose 1,7-bisphosphate phosphatase
MKPAAVILDRDGVINRSLLRDGKPCAPRDESELQVLPGVVEALRELKLSGYKLVVVTNQPDVARGKTSRSQVDGINATLKSQLHLDAVFACYHDDADGCDCRKPKPGLLFAAARELNFELTRSFMIGDRWRDIQAGRQANCTTFFIDYGYAEQAPQSFDYRVTSLREAASVILARGADS